MNCETGQIVDIRNPTKEFWDNYKQKLMEPYIKMKLEPTPKQLARTPPRVGRNEPCPCGSGSKFKKCHLVR